MHDIHKADILDLIAIWQEQTGESATVAYLTMRGAGEAIDGRQFDLTPVDCYRAAAYGKLWTSRQVYEASADEVASIVRDYKAQWKSFYKQAGGVA